MPTRPVLLVIGGGSGSGKSWLADYLKEKLGRKAVVVCQDWYYRDNGRLSPEAGRKLNFDHPKAIELPLLRRHLRELLAGRPVKAPVYDYATHARLPTVRLIEPAPVVILEGLLVLHDRALRAMADCSVFIDVPDDVRLLRRVRRDSQQRRVELGETLRLYEHCVRPMHVRFVAPSARHAELVWKPLSDPRFPARLLRRLSGGRDGGASGRIRRGSRAPRRGRG